MVAASKRAKYDAHVAFGGWTKEEAQIGYVELLQELEPTFEPERSNHATHGAGETLFRPDCRWTLNIQRRSSCESDG